MTTEFLTKSADYLINTSPRHRDAMLSHLAQFLIDNANKVITFLENDK